MAFIGEVGARLSADNSDYRAKMVEAEQVTERFDKQLKKFGLGFGGIAALATAFRAIVDYARDLQDPLDENLKRAKAFAGGLDEAKKSMLDLGARALGVVNGLGEWIGRQFAIVKNGREQVELAEKIEKQTMETLATLAKHQKTAEEIARLRNQTLEIEKRSTDEANKRLSYDERVSLVRQKIYQAEVSLQQAGEDKLAIAKADYEMAQARGELQKLETERAKEIAAEEKKAAEAAQKAAERRAETLEDIQKLKYEALPLEEKILTYVDSIENLERLILEGKKEGINVDEYVLALMENQNELARLRKERTDDTTTAEKDLLALSREQLDCQRVVVESVIAEVKARGGATEELEKQLALIFKILGVTKQVEEKFVRINRTGSNYEDQSNASLQGALARARSGIQRIRETEFQTGSNGYADSLLSFETQRIESELNSRATVGNYAAKYGEDAARRQFGDSATDKALRDMQDSTTRSSSALEEINERLKNSGLFGLNGPVPTG